MERRPGLEPGKTGFALPRLDHFGIRRKLWQGTRDSNSAIPGLESGALPIEPVPRGAPGWIRTGTVPILSRLPLPLDYRRMVPEEGFEPPRPKTPVPKTGVSAVPPLGHILVGRDGVEPPSSPETGYRVTACCLTVRPTSHNSSCQRSGGRC